MNARPPLRIPRHKTRCPICRSPVGTDGNLLLCMGHNRQHSWHLDAYPAMTFGLQAWIILYFPHAAGRFSAIPRRPSPAGEIVWIRSESRTVCGAYHILTGKEAVVRLFPSHYAWQVPEGGFTPAEKIGPSARKPGSPSNHRLAVRMDGDKPAFVSMRWRFETNWMREKGVTVPINARSETMFTNGLFKHAAKGKRCLVVVDGFYEPKGPKGAKREQYLFTFPERRPFALGGLWTKFRGEDDEFEGFVICTSSANDQISPIHARMPVMLTEEGEWDAWLEGDADDARMLCEPRETPELRNEQVG